MRSCERPSKRSAKDFVPRSVSKLYLAGFEALKIGHLVDIGRMRQP